MRISTIRREGGRGELDAWRHDDAVRRAAPARQTAQAVAQAEALPAPSVRLLTGTEG